MFTGMMKKQLETFVSRLKSMDGEEIGGVVLMALDIQNGFKLSRGHCQRKTYFDGYRLNP